MTARHFFASNRTFAAILTTTLLLIGRWSSAQTLTASANPSAVAAGVNTSYITGSGFPAGAITGATVSIGAACAAPALASTPATRVTTLGTLRRFEFLPPGTLPPGTYKVWVSGKAGATSFNTANTPSCSSLTLTSTVRGTASLGAAIVGGAVTLVDAAGTVRVGTTASDGSYAVPTTGLVPPFLVKVVTTAEAGAFPAGTALYSVSADGNASSRINVTVLSDLIVRSYYSAQDLDPNTAFANPVGDPAPTPLAVASLAGILLPTLQVWLDRAGITATGGVPANGAINVISSPLVAYPPGVTPAGGLDRVLHNVTSQIINPDGSVGALSLASGTLTETITPVSGNGLVTFNFTTTDGATGAGSAGALSTVVLTPGLDPMLAGIGAALTNFQNTLNAKGAALTVADLLPFYAPDYLHSGTDAMQDATETVGELAGVSASIAPVGIRSLNGNVVDVLVSFLFDAGNGETFSGTDSLIMKNEGGIWMLFGNQRIADVSATVEARTFQGGAASPIGTINKVVDVFAGADAPLGQVTAVTVSGPTNNPSAKIWNGLSSRPLFKGASRIEDGHVREQWSRLSSGLGVTVAGVSSLVPPGSNFDFSLTTNGLGSPQYSVMSNIFTTENVQFTNLPAHIPLANAVNHTLHFTFTLPKTFSANGVFLFAQIFSGLPNNPNATSCGIGRSGPLTLDFVNHTGSGSLTFPANMSACGLNPSVPIAFINVFFEVEGTVGEHTITFASIPY